jgi:hypothetical protein
MRDQRVHVADAYALSADSQTAWHAIIRAINPLCGARTLSRMTSRSARPVIPISHPQMLPDTAFGVVENLHKFVGEVAETKEGACLPQR